MPRKRTITRRRRHNGGNIRDVIGKVNDFLKKHKIISRGASVLAPFTGTYAPLVAGVGTAAGASGPRSPSWLNQNRAATTITFSCPKEWY